MPAKRPSRNPRRRAKQHTIERAPEKLVAATDSTCLRRVEHNRETGNLDVEFRDSGAAYRYSGVNRATANNLARAQSVGKYYNNNIKYEYPYERLRSGYRARKRRRR